MIRRFLVAGAIVALSTVSALAGEPARDALLSAFAAQAAAGDASFTGFSTASGEKLFRGRFTGGDERTPSCTSCHTDDPRQMGRNAKTGRNIDPVAPSVNAQRFTDMDQVEKQFGRDCKSVLGRACTALEKGNYITFMAGQ